MRKATFSLLLGLFVISSLITPPVLIFAQSSNQSQFNKLQFCANVYNFLKGINGGDRNPTYYGSPFNKADFNLYQIQLKLAQCAILWNQSSNNSLPSEQEQALQRFISEYCIEKYTSQDFTFQTICDTWNNPTPSNVNLVNLYTNPMINRGGNTPSSLITSYKIGEEIGKELADLENSKCTPENPGIGIWSWFQNPFTAFFRLIFKMFNTLLGWLADVFVFLLTPKNFGGFVNFQPVKEIWKVMRDLANLGIILGFILMAVATILKIEKYSWEKILWRLVIVALLVNFSLVICGMLVDLSNFLTTYFLTGVANQPLEFKTILQYTTTKIVCAPVGEALGGWHELAAAMLGIVVVIIFIGQILGLILYTIIRIITLWLTLGLSPLAFLSLAFPGLEKIADSWKNYFTQALVSLPIIAFSFLIVLTIMINIVSSYLYIVAQQTVTQKFIALVAYSIIIIILSQATLTIAGAIGIQQIKAGYQSGTKLIWGALGFAGGAALRWSAKNTVSSESWRKAAETLEKSNVKMLHDLGIRMKGVNEKTREGELNMLSKRAASLAENQLRQEAERYQRWGDRRAVAVFVDELSKRGKIQIQDNVLVDYAKNYINVSQLKKANPYLFVKHYTKDEDKQKIRLDIEQKYPQWSKNEIENELQKQLIIKQIEETSPEKLREANWPNISEYLEKQDKLQETLQELVDKIPPEAMAAIAQTYGPKAQIEFIEKLKKAVEQKAQQNNMPPEDYLGQIKGYYALRYFQSILKPQTQKKTSV
ncbi:MAG: hypothetical protein ACPLXB_00315 [Minisyncoccia bacterium]